jgi:endonuclease/exonuclease/phosphatase family metal-dependent hydrolase
MLRPVLVSLLVLAGCAQRGLPTDRSIEARFPAAPKVTTLPNQLRVVTFNIHMEPAEKIARGIKADRAIRDADVIVMQEVDRREPKGVPAEQWCSGACGVAKELGYYSVFAPGHGVPGGSHGVAVLSRAPITSASVIELPYFNVVFNSGRRVAMAVTLEIEGKPITVYAVHLDNRLTVTDRRTQMLPVLAHAKRQQTPVIIAGDFNTSPFTWIGHVIPVPTTTQDNRFEELVRADGFDTPVAESGPTFRYIGMKLDGIYTRGFETTRFAVANAEYVSDHLALWAQVQPKAEAPRAIAGAASAAR